MWLRTYLSLRSCLPALPWRGHHKPHHAATEGRGGRNAAGTGRAQAEEGSRSSQARWVHLWCYMGGVREGEREVWRKSGSRWLCSTLCYLIQCQHLKPIFLPSLWFVFLFPPPASPSCPSHHSSHLSLPPIARDLSATRQEHSQTLEKMTKEHQLEVQGMEHASQLKKKELEVCRCSVGWDGGSAVWGTCSVAWDRCSVGWS